MQVKISRNHLSCPPNSPLTRTPRCHSLFLSSPLTSPSKLLNGSIIHIASCDTLSIRFIVIPPRYSLYESFSRVFFVVNFDICIRSGANKFVCYCELRYPNNGVSSECVCIWSDWLRHLIWMCLIYFLTSLTSGSPEVQKRCLMGNLKKFKHFYAFNYNGWILKFNERTFKFFYTLKERFLM